MDAENLGPVFRLVYRSRSTIAPARRDDELAGILGTAALKNGFAGVTGALLAWQDAFVQVLEGDEVAVRALYATIAADPRHEQVETLDADTVPVRVFGTWSMARVGDVDGVDIPVGMDRAAASVRTGDPGRDTMLELMRQYARPDVHPLGAR